MTTEATSDTFSKNSGIAHELGPPELALFIQPRRKSWPLLPAAGAVVLFVGAVAVSLSLRGNATESAVGGEANTYDASRFGESMSYMARMRNLTVDALTLNQHVLQWYHLDDVVMGGHSVSNVSATASGELRFAGNISTRDGGFSSCSTLEQLLGLNAST